MSENISLVMIYSQSYFQWEARTYMGRVWHTTQTVSLRALTCSVWTQVLQTLANAQISHAQLCEPLTRLSPHCVQMSKCPRLSLSAFLRFFSCLWSEIVITDCNYVWASCWWKDRWTNKALFPKFRESYSILSRLEWSFLSPSLYPAHFQVNVQLCLRVAYLGHPWTVLLCAHVAVHWHLVSSSPLFKTATLCLWGHISLGVYSHPASEVTSCLFLSPLHQAPVGRRGSIVSCHELNEASVSLHHRWLGTCSRRTSFPWTAGLCHPSQPTANQLFILIGDQPEAWCFGVEGVFSLQRFVV